MNSWSKLLTVLVVIAGIGIIITALAFRFPDWEWVRWLFPTQSDRMPEMTVAVYIAFLGFATLLLALISVRSIQHSKDTLAKDSRRLIINRITEWALAVLKVQTNSPLKDTVEIAKTGGIRWI
jgi:hypothetical protein